MASNFLYEILTHKLCTQFDLKTFTDEVRHHPAYSSYNDKKIKVIAYNALLGFERKRLIQRLTLKGTYNARFRKLFETKKEESTSPTSKVLSNIEKSQLEMHVDKLRDDNYKMINEINIYKELASAFPFLAHSANKKIEAHNQQIKHNECKKQIIDDLIAESSKSTIQEANSIKDFSLSQRFKHLN